MLIIAGRVAQTYLYPLFEPHMVRGELLPARHEELKGRNCAREDGGGFTRHEVLYMVRNLICW